MDFRARAVAITGAGSGMGQRTAELFAEHGADVAVVDVDGEAAAETAETIEASAASGSAVPIVADVSNADDVRNFVERTVEEFGRIDVLHNNAGIPQQVTPVNEVTEDEWDRINAINLKGPFLGTRAVVPHMREQGGGAIVNTSSMSGLRPRTGVSAYAAAKGGLITLTKQTAAELAEDGIRVNAICPVSANTPMLPKFAPGAGTTMQEAKETVIDTIPLGRLAEPEDIAEAAVFLASEEASMITGTALKVDGGRGI